VRAVRGFEAVQLHVPLGRFAADAVLHARPARRRRAARWPRCVACAHSCAGCAGGWQRRGVHAARAHLQRRAASARRITACAGMPRTAFVSGDCGGLSGCRRWTNRRCQLRASACTSTALVCCLLHAACRTHVQSTHGPLLCGARRLCLSAHAVRGVGCRSGRAVWTCRCPSASSGVSPPAGCLGDGRQRHVRPWVLRQTSCAALLAAHPHPWRLALTSPTSCGEESSGAAAATVAPVAAAQRTRGALLS
jgi:hypothetical protein